MCVGVVPEFDDQRMALEERLHDAALDAASSAVNQANGGESGLVGGVKVVVDDGWNIGRGEGVQVELGGDRDLDRVFVHFYFYFLSYFATTFVVMPPRAENAPVTVMWRGWHAATRSSRILLVAAS